MLDYSYEIQAHENGYKVVCGIDEAGRGPLAGPVFAAAVILPENYSHPVLNAQILSIFFMKYFDKLIF